MSNFRGYNSRTDPARNKSALYGTPGYDSSVAAYNNWLYTPMDLRPTPPSVPASNPATTPGFHGPTTPVNPGNYTTPFGTASVSNPTFPAYGGAPIAGAGGPSGPSSAVAAPSVGSNPSGRADGPDISSTSPSGRADGAGVPTPPQNAMQRWQSQASPQASNLPPISPQKRYFWATGSIDAHATAADPSKNKGAVAPVQFVNSPSNWAPF